MAQPRQVSLVPKILSELMRKVNITCCPIQECHKNVSKTSGVCHIVQEGDKKVELENMQAKDIENSSKINEILKDALIEVKFTTRKDKIKWVKNFLNSVNYKKIKNKKTKGIVREIISNITTAKERTVSK